MDHTSASTTLSEIAVCGGAGDSLRARSAIDAFGRAAQRFDRVDGWNPQARRLCEAMLRAICAEHSLDPQDFEIRPQSWIEPMDGNPDAFRTGWALLLRTRFEHCGLDGLYRADAFRVATLLHRPANRMRQVDPVETAPSTDAPESQITMDHLTSEPLLGARLKSAIDIHVAGYPTLRLAGMFSRRPGRNFSSQRLSIGCARVRAAKLDGRTRHVTVTGINKSTGKSCRLDRVRFDEPLRRLIAAAIEQPSAPLTMEIVCESLDTGRAKPRQHHKLVDLIVTDRLSADA
jgi:hypothetical protein